MNNGKKILVLSTGDVRGAYEAAYKITKFLNEAGHNAVLLVRHKTKSEKFIIQIPRKRSGILGKIIEKVKSRLAKPNIATHPEYCFLDFDENREYVDFETIMSCIPFTPDLILAGMTDQFVNTAMLARLKKATNAITLTWLVDMGPLTGGCHYAWDCEGYMNNCKDCPAIVDDKYKQIPYKNLTAKLKNIKDGNIKVLAGSGWVANQAAQSTLFKGQSKIYNTNNCIDTRLMNNRSKQYAKHIFNFPDNAKIIFAGSQHTSDPRKGLPYFTAALQILWEQLDAKQRDEVHILIIGEHNSEDEHISKIPFRKLVIDFIHDYRYLALAYQAADLFVCPSIEDSGPMMVSESLACGTPVVGFEMGSVYTMVENGYNGYRAELRNSAELAVCMRKIISLTPEEYRAFSQNSIRQVEEKSSHKVAVAVIEEILNEYAA